MDAGRDAHQMLRELCGVFEEQGHANGAVASHAVAFPVSAVQTHTHTHMHTRRGARTDDLPWYPVLRTPKAVLTSCGPLRGHQCVCVCVRVL